MAQPNNTTTTVSQLSFGERLSIGLLYSCASLAGITLHILAISAAFKVKRASKSTFHILLVNVSASEVSIFVVYSLYAAPCVFVGTKVLGESFNLLVSLFQQGAFLTATYSALLIAINRAVAIRRVQAVEANRKTRFRWAVAAVCTWAAAALAIGVNTQFFCWAMFDLGKGVFRSVCVKSIQNSQLTPTPLINNTIIYGVALVYAWCVFRIWRQKKSVQAASSQKQISVYQMRLVYQAIFIWVGMAMNPIAYAIIPLVFEGFAAAVATTGTVLLRFFITPVTIFLFWNEARQIALELVPCRLLSSQSQSQADVPINAGGNRQVVSGPPVIG